MSLARAGFHIVVLIRPAALSSITTKESDSKNVDLVYVSGLQYLILSCQKRTQLPYVIFSYKVPWKSLSSTLFLRPTVGVSAMGLRSTAPRIRIEPLDDTGYTPVGWSYSCHNVNRTKSPIGKPIPRVELSDANVGQLAAQFLIQTS